MNDVIPAEENILKRILENREHRTYIEVVKSIQNVMLKGISENHIDEVKPPVIHHFGPDIYMRQMDAKAGTLVVSKMHSTEHFNILLKGAVSLITEDGIKDVYAGQIMLSKAGTKRIGYFHEDSSWITVHPTDETDLEIIEQQVIVPDDEIDQFLASLPNKCKEIE